MFYSRNTDIQIKAFFDSDWVSCVLTRHSTIGNCIFLGDSLISWKTKKQNIVSRSSSETEYRALATICCEVQWLTFLLKDVIYPSTRPQVSTMTANPLAILPKIIASTKEPNILILKEKRYSRTSSTCCPSA